MPDTNPSSHSSEVAVVVPAAGAGSRLGGTRKQFRTLGGHPVLLQVLRLFDQHPEVDHIVVVAPEGHVAAVEERLGADGLAALAAVVPGGTSRRASVRRGLHSVPSAAEIVLVHDAVRPFVQASEVSAVIAAVRSDGAAALALPVADTLRHAEDGVFGDTVPRRALYRMQTPQGFRRAWLEAAHRAAAEEEWEATDDVELVQRSGRDVHLVRGSRRNFKITRPGDWELAQQLWPVWAEGASEASSP